MKTIDETLLKKDREIEKSGIHAETNSLRELLIAELKTIYWAEKELTNAIPKMVQKASSENLKSGLAGHLEETKEHVTRLESIFHEELEIEPEAIKCEAIAGMIKGAEEIMEKTLEGSVRDAAIICAAQKVEHFEIATYGTLVTFAETIGEPNIAHLLKATLDEEHAANNKLTVAGEMINVEADKDDPNRVGKFTF